MALGVAVRRLTAQGLGQTRAPGQAAVLPLGLGCARPVRTSATQLPTPSNSVMQIFGASPK